MEASNNEAQVEGVPFNADESLAEIKKSRSTAPRDETREQLQELKSKIIEQRLGIYDVIQTIYQRSVLHGGINDQELRAIVEHNVKKYNLNEDQRQEFNEAIERFAKQQSRVSEIKKEGLTGEEVFQEALDSPPVGNVNATYSPAGIILHCEDNADLMKACEKGSLVKAMDHNDTVAISLNSGVAEKYEMLLVVAGPRADQPSIDHEIQHKLNLFYKNKRHARPHKMMKRSGNRIEHIIKESLEPNANERSIIEEIVKKEIHSVRPYLTSQVKEEITAYYRQGYEARQIPSQLKGALYLKKFSQGLVLKSADQYLENAVAELSKNPTAEEVTTLDEAREIASEISQEELLRVTTGLTDSITTLEDKGYDKQAVLAFLYAEAPEDWPAVARRLPDLSD